jgi:hypothetical protein
MIKKVFATKKEYKEKNIAKRIKGYRIKYGLHYHIRAIAMR